MLKVTCDASDARFSNVTMALHHLKFVSLLSNSQSGLMKKLPFAVILAAMILAACGSRDVRNQLQQADSLIAADKLDSALTLISAIDSTAIHSDSDRAHYYLLNTRLLYCLYRPVSDTAQIRWAAAYYAAHDGDKLKLGNTCFYLGMLELEDGKLAEAAAHLKSAEEAAAQCSDINLRHKVYDALSTLNFMTRNITLALRYANMSLDCGRKTGNNLWLAYAYNHLACIHDQIGNADSAWSYIQMCVPYTSTLNDYDRSMIYFVLADFYLRKNDYDMAANYVGQAYEINPSALVSNRLASIYSHRGDRSRARALWKQALDSATGQARSLILDTMATHLYAEGNVATAYRTLRELMTLRDSLASERETVAINEIQLKYDHQADKRHYDRLLIRILYCLIALISLMGIGIFYHLIKTSRAKRKMISDQIMINDYNRQISDLQNSGKNSAQELSRLQRMLDKIKSEQASTMIKGRELYLSIAEGHSVVTWSKSDVARFVEYYKVINLPFVMQIERDYNSLTDNNRLFLILQDMGKNDADISQILGISQGAIRTTRYRLRGKAREKSDADA